MLRSPASLSSSKGDPRLVAANLSIPVSTIVLQKATLSPPLSARMSLASSGVAIVWPSSSKNVPDFRHLLRIRNRKLTAADEERILQPNSYVAAHRRRLRREGHLETAGRQNRPSVVVSEQTVGGLLHHQQPLVRDPQRRAPASRRRRRRPQGAVAASAGQAGPRFRRPRERPGRSFSPSRLGGGADGRARGCHRGARPTPDRGARPQRLLARATARHALRLEGARHAAAADRRGAEAAPVSVT